MKLDLAKLPVGEAMVGFLLAVLAVTFVGAFLVTDSGGKEQVATTTPSPAPAASETPGASPGGPASVTMTDNKFTPDKLTVKAGSTVTIDIKNNGAAIHNMHIATDGSTFNDAFCGQGGKEACSTPNIVTAGQTAKLVWSVPNSPGTVDFRCDFHPVEMVGKITIQ